MEHGMRTGSVDFCANLARITLYYPAQARPQGSSCSPVSGEGAERCLPSRSARRPR